MHDTISRADEGGGRPGSTSVTGSGDRSGGGTGNMNNGKRRRKGRKGKSSGVDTKATSATITGAPASKSKRNKTTSKPAPANDNTYNNNKNANKILTASNNDNDVGKNTATGNSKQSGKNNNVMKSQTSAGSGAKNNANRQAKKMQNAPTQLKQSSQQKPLQARQAGKHEQRRQNSPAVNAHPDVHSRAVGKQSNTGGPNELSKALDKQNHTKLTATTSDRLGCFDVGKEELDEVSRALAAESFCFAPGPTKLPQVIGSKNTIICMKNSALEFSAKASLLIEALPFRMPNSK